MHPVTFVRTSPTALGDAADSEQAVCDSCGSTLVDESGVPIGDGYTNPLSLDALLIRHPSATYFVQVGTQEDTVISENTYLGVRTGDILMIDRTLKPTIGCLVLAVCAGELALCRYTEHEGREFLVCGERGKLPVEITAESGTSVWGVVGALSRRL